MNKELKIVLYNALKDEKNAPEHYKRLKSLLPESEKSKISYIQRQELNHYRILRNIKEKLEKEELEKEN